MLATALPTRRPEPCHPAPTPAAARIADALKLVNESVAVTRRLLHAGDTVYEAGERFECLHIVNAGLFKLVNLSADGREQVVGLQFKGDWLGFDGIASGRHACDAVAMDTGEVWTVRYDVLLAACAKQPALMGVLHAAMSREMTRDRDALLSICTLPADARVAEFLHQWASSLSDRGLRTDQITLRMTRAEIGNYLGMKLETVSRALSRLARDAVIAFSENGRRDVRIPDMSVLAAFVQRCLAPEGATLQ
jgi:CRP/FNR family transcriptional regulator, anaerobic regulatory protein